MLYFRNRKQSKNVDLNFHKIHIVFYLYSIPFYFRGELYAQIWSFLILTKKKRDNSIVSGLNGFTLWWLNFIIFWPVLVWIAFVQSLYLFWSTSNFVLEQFYLFLTLKIQYPHSCLHYTEDFYYYSLCIFDYSLFMPFRLLM